MAGREPSMPWDRILEDPALSPGEKYRQLRAEYPTFGEYTIRLRIHEQHPHDRPFSHLDDLVERRGRGRKGTANKLRRLTAPELHYFVMYSTSGLDPDDLPIMTEALGNNALDYGTALMLYWAAVEHRDPPDWDEELEEDDEEGKRMDAEYRAEWRSRMEAFTEQIRARLKGGTFASRCIRFDPAQSVAAAHLAHGDPDLRHPSPGEPFDEFGGPA